MAIEREREPRPIEALSLPDPRILQAGAIALKRYEVRRAYIREYLENDPRGEELTAIERDEMSDRLMRRLVERS